MANSVIQVSYLSKSYRLGTIGSRTLTEDLNRWWAKLRKQPDPYLRIGQEDLSDCISDCIWALKDINFQTQRIKGHSASLPEVGIGFHPELTRRENVF